MPLAKTTPKPAPRHRGHPGVKNTPRHAAPPATPVARSESSSSSSSQPQQYRTPPATRKAPGDREKPHDDRDSSGLLSEQTMSQIRCPSRVDFINAVKGVPPSTPHFGSATALARSQLRFAATVQPDSPEDAPADLSVRAPLVALRTSRLTDESRGTTSSPASEDTACCNASMDHPHPSVNGGRVSGTDAGSDEDDEDGVPAYLNSLVLDAMDRIGECDELKAIVAWMDSVRSRAGLPRSITDIDLTNGVALLQTLKVVAPEAFEGAPAEDAAVCMDLDEAGKVARDNMCKVCTALRRFPWRDGPDGAALDPVPFDRVDVWSLSGYVVLAAVTGNQASAEVDRMMQMDEWVQDRLSDIVSSGLHALGAPSSQNDGRHNGWFAERRKNEMLEMELIDLQNVVEQLKMQRDELEILLAEERQAGEDARAELRWLRAAIGRRRRVLGETNEFTPPNSIASLRKENGMSRNATEASSRRRRPGAAPHLDNSA